MIPIRQFAELRAQFAAEEEGANARRPLKIATADASR